MGEEGFVWSIFDFVIGLGNEFLQSFPAVENLLTQYEQPVSTILGLVLALNAFFPVQETISLIGIYLVFVAVVIVLKIILKVIPGMGG